MFTRNSSPGEIVGAMEIAKRLHEMPLRLYDSKDFNDSIIQRLKADYALVTSSLVKRFLES
jgi:hypothetical protein